MDAASWIAIGIAIAVWAGVNAQKKKGSKGPEGRE